MGTARAPKPVKLIASVFSGAPDGLECAEALLVEQFGSIDFRSEHLPFDHTGFYAQEFGTGIVREIVSFARLVDPASLPDIKLATNDLEGTLTSPEGNRLVNIDAGYVSEGKLVLATTKDHRHRIYLDKGIYGEVTLYYHAGTFWPWDWTYPDYASERYREIFTEIRRRYRDQLRSL